MYSKWGLNILQKKKKNVLRAISFPGHVKCNYIYVALNQFP